MFLDLSSILHASGHESENLYVMNWKLNYLKKTSKYSQKIIFLKKQQ